MLELYLVILGLFFSILFSSSEIALISASKLQIDVWVKQNYKLGTLTKFIIDNKSKFLTVSLIGTNLSNILTSTFATVYLIDIITINSFNFPKAFLFFPIALTILIFGEIMPKTLIREYSNIMLLILSPVLYIFYYLFFPFIYIFDLISISNTKLSINEKRQEFDNIFENNDNIDSIEKDQKEIISNIFEYREESVEQVMTKLKDISAISIDNDLDDLAHKFIDSGHSKLPVYENNLNNVKGVIYLYDLFTKPENINDIIRDVLFVPYTKLIPDLLKLLKETKHSIAIVIDKQGNTSGLITVEDIFEELFGDFEDEFDYKKLESWINKDSSIITNANIKVDNFNEKYNNIIPKGDYETLAGYIINEIDRIPNKNEHLFLTIGHVIIKKASSRRIEQIQIFKN